VIERSRFAARSSAIATPPLMADATAETATPVHASVSGCGFRQRSQAAKTIPHAAAMMRNPSTPEEKYSAFV
jgi:hypothetical protein